MRKGEDTKGKEEKRRGEERRGEESSGKESRGKEGQDKATQKESQTVAVTPSTGAGKQHSILLSPPDQFAYPGVGKES